MTTTQKRIMVDLLSQAALEFRNSTNNAFVLDNTPENVKFSNELFLWAGGTGHEVRANWGDIHLINSLVMEYFVHLLETELKEI